MNNIAKRDEEIATHADYAAQNFEALISSDEANRFGGEILQNECAGIRVAAVTLSKSRQELLDGFSNDTATLMQTIEYLQGQEEFLGALKESNS